MDEDPEHLRLYTSSIPSAFLSIFEYPETHQHRHGHHSRHSSHSSLKIAYKKIPYRPYSTLRERLLEETTPLTKGEKTKDEPNDEEKKISEKMKLSSLIYNL